MDSVLVFAGKALPRRAHLANNENNRCRLGNYLMLFTGRILGERNKRMGRTWVFLC